MRRPSFLTNDIAETGRADFQRSLVKDNILRGRILAVIVIVLETILAFSDAVALLLEVDGRFFFSGYMLMYLLMIAINIFYLWLLNQFREISDSSWQTVRKADAVIIAYVTFMMTWGSVIALMDQRLYGHLLAFIVNMITCSIIYFMDNKKVIIPYAVSSLVLIVGLPFFQSSRDVLTGHYINLCIFILISWVASRIVFKGYCNDYKSRVQLNESKALLELEIEENKKMNIRLSLANLQLKDLALIDELTAIPNRRSFRHFVDRAFENHGDGGLDFSVIIADIDFFKEYNDNYGHEAGDQALVAVAAQMFSIVQGQGEFVGRWGGEEFIYAVVNAGEERVNRVADNIREKVLELDIAHEYSAVLTRVSVSLGISTIRAEKKEDVRLAIQLADKALYRAKSSGRNCVRSYRE